MADDARKLYEKLLAFKEADEPCEALVRHCRTVLGAVERLHFDYKTKQNRLTVELDEHDRKNLGKALSGFANSGGGVLIWGMKDAEPVEPKPIANVHLFVKAILDLVSNAAEPSVAGVDGDFISSEDGEGFALLLVPESTRPPHRVAFRLKEVQGHYYMRTGSDFVVAPHSHLEDMFGRRPRANLRIEAHDYARWKQPDGWHATGTLINEGRGTARDIYVLVEQRDGVSVTTADGWRHVGVRPRAFGQTPGILFRLDPLLVVHAGMNIDFRGVLLQRHKHEERQPVQLDYVIFADGLAPHRGVLSTTLEAVAPR